MEIAEFLLARIADDERVWGNGAFAPVAGQGLSRLILKTRAECEAKRRIVEDFRVLHRDYQETHWSTTEARRFQALVAVAHLASVYADHPDYRAEWKP